MAVFTRRALRGPLLRGLQATWDAVPMAVRRRVLFFANDHFLLGVVGLIEDEEGRLLLLDHRFRTPWRWGLPGGFIHRSEPPSSALVRELREEVGLEAIVAREVFDTEVNTLGGYVSLTLRGRTRGRKPPLELKKNVEIAGGGFFFEDEIPPETYPVHLEIIRRHFATRTP